LAGELVAGENEVGNATHHPVEQVDGKTNGPRSTARGGNRGAGGRAGLGPRRLFGQRLDERRIVLAAGGLAGHELFGQFGDPVDDGEHGADQRRIGPALAFPHGGERILGCMAQGGNPRQVEETAIAFDGVNEAENLVEACAIVRRRLPGDKTA